MQKTQNFFHPQGRQKCFFSRSLSKKVCFFNHTTHGKFHFFVLYDTIFLKIYRKDRMGNHAIFFRKPFNSTTWTHFQNTYSPLVCIIYSSRLLGTTMAIKICSFRLMQTTVTIETRSCRMSSLQMPERMGLTASFQCHGHTSGLSGCRQHCIQLITMQ